MERVIIVNSEFFGKGDEWLGKKLLGAFLRKVWANSNKPDAIILYNSGVKIAATGSEMLEVIVGLHESGVDILACGTCVSHYGLEHAMHSARISNMDEIAGIMLSADHVVTV